MGVVPMPLNTSGSSTSYELRARAKLDLVIRGVESVSVQASFGTSKRGEG